jgi:hypothetical protein
VIKNGSIAVSFENETGTDLNGKFFFAIYNENGQMVHVDTRAFVAPAVSGLISDTFPAMLDQYPADTYVRKAFCWDENNIPLAPAVVPEAWVEPENVAYGEAGGVIVINTIDALENSEAELARMVKTLDLVARKLQVA